MRLNQAVLSLAIVAASAAGIQILSAGPNVWTRLGPEGGPVTSLVIDPRNPSTVYAATDAGLYKSVDEGAGWAAIKPGPPCCISKLLIHPQDSSVLYAVTQLTGLSPDRRVLKSVDGGANWSAVNSGLPLDSAGRYSVIALAIDPRNQTTLYAANALKGSGVFKTTDGGENWSAVNSGLPDGGAIAALAIDPQNPDTLYTASAAFTNPQASNSGVFKSADGGASWTAVNSGLPISFVRGYEYFSVLAIDPQNPDTLYAAANDGLLYKTADAGANWAELKEMASATVIALAIDPGNSGVVYAGTSGGVSKSTDAGAHWSAVRLTADTYGPPVVPALAIDLQNPDTLYAASTYAGILKTTDAGASWATVNSDLRATVPMSFALKFDPKTAGTIYAATDAGVFKTTDAGENWTGFTAGLQGGSVTTLAIDAQNPSTIYALDTPPPNDDGYCFYYCGQIFKSLNGGANWDTPLAREASGLVVRGARLYSSTGNALAIDPRDARTIYVGGTFFQSGQQTALFGVLKSTDGGATWNVATSGLPGGNASNQGNSTFVRTLAIDPQNPNTIYAGIDTQGFAPGSAIFKSTDGGGSWRDAGMHGFASVDILAIDSGNPATLYAKAVDRIGCSPQSLPVRGGFDGCGWLYKTTNGGASWSLMNAGLPNYVTALAIDTQNAGTIYAGSGVGVFRSRDGGTSWMAVNSGLTNIGISTLGIDPRNPGTVYAGTADGVFAITFGVPALP